MQTLQTVTRPTVDYVLEEKYNKDAEDEDNGGPDDPIAHLNRQLRRVKDLWSDGSGTLENTTSRSPVFGIRATSAWQSANLVLVIVFATPLRRYNGEFRPRSTPPRSPSQPAEPSYQPQSATDWTPPNSTNRHTPASGPSVSRSAIVR